MARARRSRRPRPTSSSALHGLSSSRWSERLENTCDPGSVSHPSSTEHVLQRRFAFVANRRPFVHDAIGLIACGGLTIAGGPRKAIFLRRIKGPPFLLFVA